MATGRGVGAGLWAVLLAGPAWFIVNLTATSRAMSLDARDPATIAFAHSHGATDVLAWVVDNDLGGAIVILTVVVAVAAVLIVFGALVARDIQRNPPSAATRQDA